MNLKNYVIKKADEVISPELSESDEEYCRELLARSSEYKPVNVKPKRKVLALLSCAASVLLFAVIAMLVIFVPGNSEMTYHDSEIKNKTSSIEEINNASKYFETRSVEYAIGNECVMYYDSVSGDNLYFIQDMFSFVDDAHLVFVVNPRYNYRFVFHEQEKQTQVLEDYVLTYTVAESGELEGIPTMVYSGWIEHKKEKVYITYTQYTGRDENAFFDYIQNVVKIKG